MSKHDTHTLKASELFGVEPEEVTESQRRYAKMESFGARFGVTQEELEARVKTLTAANRSWRHQQDRRTAARMMWAFVPAAIMLFFRWEAIGWLCVAIGMLGWFWRDWLVEKERVEMAKEIQDQLKDE